MRTVELTGFDADTNLSDEWQATLGYLSTWGLGAYSHVQIIDAGRMNSLVASYWVEQPAPGTPSDYVIAAIWNVHTRQFSFKSSNS